MFIKFNLEIIKFTKFTILQNYKIYKFTNLQNLQNYKIIIKFKNAARIQNARKINAKCLYIQYTKVII